jgi:hypothetical protein
MPDSNPLGQQPPAQNGGGIDKQALIRLAALIPLAMSKGGQPAVAGLLNGFQQGMARQRQMGMEQSQQDWQQQYQQAQLTRQDAAEGRLQENADRQAEQQRLEQRRKFLELATGNPEADEAEAMQRLEMLTRQAPSFGVSQLDVEQAAYVAPTRRQKAQLIQALKRVDDNFPDGEARENMTLTGHNGPDGKPMQVWQARQLVAGTSGTGPVVKPPTAGGSSDFARSMARYAAKLGKKPEDLTFDEEQAGRKEIEAVQPPQRISVNTGAADARTNARIDRIVNSFNSHPIVKEFNEIQSQHAIIKGIVESQWSGPGDMAAVFAFMKALDPTSVVRETEYANAAKSGNIFQGWAARFNGALNPNGGFLSDRVRRDFLRTIEGRLGYKAKQYEGLRGQLVQRVDRIRSGAPETGDEALINYTVAPDEAAASPAPPTPVPRRSARAQAQRDKARGVTSTPAAEGWTTMADGTRMRVKEP